jgi:hypothetical protein
MLSGETSFFATVVGSGAVEAVAAGLPKRLPVSRTTAPDAIARRVAAMLSPS